MAPGTPPPLPKTGTLEEGFRLYIETVSLYKECEINKKELVDWINKK